MSIQRTQKNAERRAKQELGRLLQSCQKDLDYTESLEGLQHLSEASRHEGRTIPAWLNASTVPELDQLLLAAAGELLAEVLPDMNVRGVALVAKARGCTCEEAALDLGLSAEFGVAVTRHLRSFRRAGQRGTARGQNQWRELREDLANTGRTMHRDPTGDTAAANVDWERRRRERQERRLSRIENLLHRAIVERGRRHRELFEDAAVALGATPADGALARTAWETARVA